MNFNIEEYYNDSIISENNNFSESFFDIKKIILVIVFVISLFIVLFNNDRKFIVNKNRIAITGDSYASYLYNKLYDEVPYSVESYFIAGRTIIENEQMMLKAMNSSCKYVFVSIGVNDHFKNTNLQLFHDTYEKIIKEGLKNKKVIFTHSFVEYPVSKNFISKYSTHDYDNIIRTISDRYEDVYYININKYADEKYFEDDNLHLNKMFYKYFYGMILSEFDKKSMFFLQ